MTLETIISAIGIVLGVYLLIGLIVALVTVLSGDNPNSVFIHTPMIVRIFLMPSIMVFWPVMISKLRNLKEYDA